MGPRPEDIDSWNICCPQYSRLELCPFVPCNVPPRIQCLLPAACLAISQSAPLIYACNDHGTPRADGTCECDTDLTGGQGYTSDFTEFSDDGCYQEVQCPFSPVTNVACSIVPSCSDPSQLRYPFPFDIYFEQQALTCDPGKGELNNVTKLSELSVSVDNFNQVALQALGNIAVEVQAAEDSLAACICVYPDDTAADKCCMVPNGKSYVYEQNFNYPYLLTIQVEGSPFLTDNSLESIPIPSTFINVTIGDRLKVNLSNNVSTTITSIRVFGTGNATLLFSTSKGGTVCPQAIMSYLPGSNSLFWDLDSGAHFCGPFYSCVNSRNFPDYLANCGIKSNTIECLAYKQAACVSSSPQNVFWAPDSISYYPGCLRTSVDADGCTCCQLQIQNENVIDGRVNIDVTGASALIGQIRFYGYTGSAISVPSGLSDYLSQQGATTCRDLPFLQSYLDVDGSLFVPPQSKSGSRLIQTPVSRLDSLGACNQTGGYLATGTNINNQSDVNDLVNACSSLKNNQGNQNPTCWVNAFNTQVNDTTAPRSLLFNSATCTVSGCYELSQSGIPSFFVNNTNTYDTPVFSSQTSANSLQSMLSNTNFAFGYQSYMLYDAQCDIPAMILTFSNGICSFPLVITSLPQIVTDPTRRATHYMFGEQINLDAMYFTDLQPLSTCSERSETLPAWKVMTGITVTNLQGVHPGIYVYLQFYSHAKNNVAGGNGGDNYNGYSRGLFVDVSGPFSSGGYYFGGGFSTTSPSCPSGCNNLTNSYRYMAVFPDNSPCGENPKASYAQVTILNQDTDSGTVGIDYSMGFNSHSFVPLFLKIEKIFVVGNGVNPDTLASQNSFLPSLPYYTTVLTNVQITTPITQAALAKNLFQFTNMFTCTSCILPIDASGFIWDELATPNRDGTVFMGNFNGPKPVIYIGSANLQNATYPLAPLTSFRNPAQLNIFVNMVNYINAKSLNPNPPFFQWQLSSCLAVNASGAVGLPCVGIVNNYVCSYDWTKYAVLGGYMCPSCGCSTRVGGVPDPGLSCFADNPLANATLFPYEHSVKSAYDAGTLDLYAASFNLGSESIDFGNTSVIAGIKEDYLLIMGGVSTRAGRLSKNSQATLNWCDLDFAGAFPVDCGDQVDPRTGHLTRYCASSSAYCNILLPDQPNAQMQNASRPPILYAVSEVQSFTDPTCGPYVLLSSYAVTDKFGGPQSDLSTLNGILVLDSSSIQISVISSSTIWYNAGKTNTQYKFEWNVPVTISGSYVLFPCDGCVSPSMDVFVHPLNPEYVLGDVNVSVSIPLTVSRVTQTFSVVLTVNVHDTGTVTINGETFPLLVFRGVGFNFNGLSLGSGLILSNPVLTDPSSRLECTTREAPIWFEPKTRYESTTPNRVCVITKAQQLQYPGQEVGTCACDISSAGRTCSCPAVTSKFGKAVCGGFGDESVSVLSPSGAITTTGATTEAGCYYYGSNGDLTNSDCKTIDIGRVLFSLLVPGAVFEQPSVYVEAIPVKGASIFQMLPNVNGGFSNKTSLSLACELQGMQLPYFYTSDELNQLVQTSFQTLPVIMGIDTTQSNSSNWLWESPIYPSYFIYGNSGSFSTRTGICATAICSDVNFNNFAFSGLLANASDAFLIDGNTIVTSTTTNYVSAGQANRQITWAANGPLDVQIYIFQATFSTTLVSCLSGTCNGKQSGLNVVFQCRCPNRILQYTGGVVMSEIQVFSSSDSLRSTSYIYT